MPAVVQTLFAVAIIGVAGAVIVWRAFAVEPKHPVTSRHRIVVRGWPTNSSYKILQLSDLHLWDLGPLHRRIIEQVEALSPDLIVLTGDYAESDEGIEALGTLLRQLRALAPVYAVLGDNDQEEEAWQRQLEVVFAREDVVLLRNRAALINIKDAPLMIIGLDDPNAGLSQVNQAKAHAEELLHAAVISDLEAIPTVVLAHSPEVVVELEPWMDLILTGHTHGGQICLPGGRALYTNTPRCKGFASGMYTVRTHGRLYVHRGVGTARIPARLFCPPEVALFELVGQDR